MSRCAPAPVRFSRFGPRAAFAYSGFLAIEDHRETVESDVNDPSDAGCLLIEPDPMPDDGECHPWQVRRPLT